MRFRESSLRLLLLALVVAAACDNDRDPVDTGENTRLEVLSDPPGASIEMDGALTGRTTPNTFFDISGGRHELIVRLDRDGIGYGYRTEVDIRGDSLHRVNGPLMFRCAGTTCLLNAARVRDFGNIRFSSQANGALFMKSGQGDGLLYPLGFSNSMVSIGMPMIAMVAGTRDTLALGIYDIDYLAGRPEPIYQSTATRISLRQSAWIIPPTSVILGNAPTVRGIEIEEEVIGEPGGEVVFVRLTFRNITDRETYRAADPVVPSGGLQFNGVYLGFALDPDIGTPGDDMFTYEPLDSLVYAYDSNFLEEIFAGGFAGTPPLIGLKVVAKPAGATAVSLNGWPATLPLGSGDWRAGTATEPGGYSMISGFRSIEPDYPGQFIGHVPTTPNDFRLVVGAGPVSLAPGETASITVAVIIAPPVEGEYTIGQTVAPGDPGVANRQISRIAGTLIDRARNLVVP